jgi:ubiquinone/menaquinone biosynthesis C-methylase UbiE
MSDQKSRVHSSATGPEVDPEPRQRMLAYYNERASEYEEAYTLGTGTGSIPDPNVFTTEIKQLPDVVRRFAHGRLLDVACGTAYWLPHYAERVSHVTLFDQSANMLALAGRKCGQLGIAGKCDLVQADFFEYEFSDRAYDSALLGFFISHVTEEEEARLFSVLRRILTPSGKFVILDSAWSAERARFNAKVERQQRRLNDGTLFEIYKRYLDHQDLSAWANKYNATISIEHSGPAFLALSGRFDT